MSLGTLNPLLVKVAMADIADWSFPQNKAVKLTNKDKSIVYCEVRKRVYIANKAFFKNKQKIRKNNKTQ
jgi:hypothetical protein